MSEIEEIKMRLRNKRNKLISNDSNSSNVIDVKKKYINNLISRTLIAVIIFSSLIIVMNMSDDVKSFVNNNILKENISFTKISNIYNKYFGKVLPINESGFEAKTVFNEKLAYNNLVDYKDGYELSVTNNYIVPIIKSGIVVFIGEKDDYGKTVIIEGNDEIDYWYGNLDNVNVSLYDVVNSGEMIGNIIDDKLYLVFKKNNEYLSYDEVME